MAHNFLRGDRDQPFLLPPDVRNWLPEGHLAWFILDVVDQLDLDPFYRAHRDDGHGHPAYDPKTLLSELTKSIGAIGTLDICSSAPWDWDDSEIAAAQAYAGLVASLLAAAVTAHVKGRLASQLQAPWSIVGRSGRPKGSWAENGWTPRRPLSSCGGRSVPRPGGWRMWPGMSPPANRCRWPTGHSNGQAHGNRLTGRTVQARTAERCKQPGSSSPSV